MNNKRHMTKLLMLASAAGTCATALGADPVSLPVSTAQVQDIAHIYYNLITGERVVTLADADQTVGADTGNSVSVWSTRGPQPDCVTDFGYTNSFFFALDDPGTSSLSTAATLLDFGDIELDTVVDCLSINWVVAHPDSDTNLDSVGDGVEELAAQWMVWDADNGRSINQSTRLPLVDFLFFNLPGNIASPGFLSGYTADVDLVGFGTGTDLSFEIGDSDGDCQSAAFCNNNVDITGDGVGDGVSVSNVDRDFDSILDSDLDGDGLFDFSWTVRFFQPGIGNDFDSDLDTGSAAATDADAIGIAIGFPVGANVIDGMYSIDDSIPNAGTGAEDRFALYSPPDLSGGIFYAGGFNLGGFQCPDIDTPFVPAAIFAFEMWGPGTVCCTWDLNCDGVLNFFDVSMFIQQFTGGDLAADFTGDGVLNFFDVSAFIGGFSSGCP